MLFRKYIMRRANEELNRESERRYMFERIEKLDNRVRVLEIKLAEEEGRNFDKTSANITLGA